jgi:glycosyltransferase involved in cell wall biosynthesis
LAAPLRVLLDARIPETGSLGGVEQVIIGLAGGLAALADGDEEYVFLAYDGSIDWLTPFVGANSRIQLIPLPGGYRARSKIGNLAPLLRPLYHAWKNWRGHVATSDGAIEALRPDVIHFTYQNGFLTDVPSIYQPHDLQHMHLPEYFRADVAARRNLVYRALCSQAQIVAVGSKWTKADFVEQLGLEPGKVRVIPLAPSTALYPMPTRPEVKDCRTRYDLPERFAFYPAQSWPHKNHLKLLEALRLIRDEHLVRIPLVASGKRTPFYFDTILPRIRALQLDDQVQFLDFVTPLDLQCLYRLSTVCVIPTKFEAGSFPMWEAFLAGVPVACSAVTSLPAQAGCAALFFDPNDARAMAQAVLKIWHDVEFRSVLVRKGTARVAMFDWTSTARHFRATYREIAGRPLTADDKALLSAPSLM